MKIKGVTRVRVTKVEKKTDTRSMVYFKSTRKNKDEQFVDSLFIGTFVANANNKIGDLTSVLDKLEKWDNGQAKQ